MPMKQSPNLITHGWILSTEVAPPNS